MRFATPLRRLMVYKDTGNDGLSGFIKNSFQRWELYPLWACGALWAGIFTGIIIHSFNKEEIWVNRANKVPPLIEWERTKDTFGRRKKFIDYPNGSAPIPALNAIQEEMALARKNQS